MLESDASSGLPEPENPTLIQGIFPNSKPQEPEIFTMLQAQNYPNPNFSRFQLTVGSCENGISDSIPILILGNHRFQNFWKGTHVKIELE